MGSLSYSARHMATSKRAAKASTSERFGARLRELRQRRRISQEVLGEKVGSDGPRIHRLEKGSENPTLETLDKLADALEVDVSEFLVPVREQESAGARRVERNQILEDRWGALLEALDAEVPAEDSWRGDVLKAVAALNRALRRPAAPAETPEISKKAGR